MDELNFSSPDGSTIQESGESNGAIRTRSGSKSLVVEGAWRLEGGAEEFDRENRVTVRVLPGNGGTSPPRQSPRISHPSTT